MMNVNITICKSIREINEKVDSTTCKLILLDGGTTSISSIELIQYIRTTKLIVAPVWFFTEIVTPSYILKAKQLGVSLIVNKPFDPHKITDEIATLPFQ
jgi:DNA-binding response OmpR family regulator